MSFLGSFKKTVEEEYKIPIYFSILDDNNISVFLVTSISLEEQEYSRGVTHDMHANLHLQGRMLYLSFRDFISRFNNEKNAKPMIDFIVFKHPEYLI